MTSIDSAQDSFDERLDRVIAEYLRAEELGLPVDSQEVLRQNPDLAGELASFFHNRDVMRQVAGQLRPQELSTTDEQGDANRVDESARDLVDFGDYEMVSEIARGGMGIVYRARQRSLQRTVALKMIRAGDAASGADLARFRQEAEAAARLDHPHIVPVYEVGAHEGRCYYTMKLMEGGDLSSQRARICPDPPAAARTVEKVARAIHFAHQHGILHRDLKPANILVDPAGEPHVADFGLARLVDSQDKMTQTGAALGTPGYMSPEQIRGEKLTTTAADVYSLGAILFYCLTGQPPFRAASAWEAMQLALDSEPPSPRAINPKIDRDVETICRKALERAPEQRYESAAALADDLARWLAHEPIAARPPGPVRRALKWVRRHPAWTAVIAATVCILLVAAVQGRITAVALQGERRAIERAEGLLYRTLLALAEREWSAGVIYKAREALGQCPEPRRGWEWAYARKLCYVTPANNLGEFPTNLADGGFSADGRRICVIDFDGNVWVWDTAGREVAHLKVDATDSVPRAALAPDGQRIAVATRRHVQVFDLATSKQLWAREGLEAIAQMKFSPDGHRIGMFCSRGLNGSKTRMLMLLGDDGSSIAELPVKAARTPMAEWFAFAPDQRLLVYPQWDHGRAPPDPPAPLLALNSTTGEQLPDEAIPLTPEKGVPYSAPVAISPDGNLLIYDQSFVRQCFELRSRHDGRSIRIPTNTYHPYAFTFSPDSRMFAYVVQELNVDIDGLILREAPPTFGPAPERSSYRQPWMLTVRVWDATNGKEVSVIRGLPGNYAQLCFSPDGRRLMAYGGITKNEAVGIPRSFGVAMLWDASARQTARSLNASTQAIHDVAVSPDGRRIVTAGEDHVVRVWDAASGSLLREITGHRAPCKSLAFGNDPQQVLVAGGSDAILWNCETGERLQTFEKPLDAGDWRIHGAAIRPDGKQVALADGAQGRVQVFDVATGHRELELQERVQFISYSPDGSLLALSYHFDRHGELKIVDAVNGRVRHHFKTDQHNRSFLGLMARSGWGYVRAEFSPDSRYVAAVGNIGGVHLYDLRADKLVKAFQGHDTTVWDVAFTSDGKRLATSGYSDGTVKLWSVASGEEVHTLRGHEGQVTGLAFSPDNSRLVTADTTGLVRIWEAQ